MSESFKTWKDKLLFWAVTAMVSSASAFTVWAAMAITDRPTRDEVKRVVQVAAPYNEDRKLIIQRLESVRETESRITQVIDRNTEAITALKVELAKLQ